VTDVLHKSLVVGIVGVTILGAVNIVNGIYYKMSIANKINDKKE
jgi:hypothetical protein